MPSGQISATHCFRIVVIFLYIYITEKVTREWRRVHSKEHHSLYCSPGELGWCDIYSELGEREVNTNIQRENVMGTDQLED
jgi:hypothetical protein